MSNILEYFAPDISVDFEELGEQIDLDQIGSDEILSANSDQQNLPINNNGNSICRDSEYDSIDAKVGIDLQVVKDDSYGVILNKMSIEHLLQNEDVKEEINYADYFSEISMNDSKEVLITDDIEISPLKPNVLNFLNEKENDSFVSTHIAHTHIDNAVCSNNDSSWQKDKFKAIEEEITSSGANGRETVEASISESLGNVFNDNLYSHVTSIHETSSMKGTSNNDIIEKSSVIENNGLINSVIIKKSGSDEIDDKNMGNEDSKDLQTSALLLLANLALSDADASPVEEIPNISRSETNAQEVTTNVLINDNQIEIKNMICRDNDNQDVSNGSPELQFLPEQSTKDFESERDIVPYQGDLIVSNDSNMMIPEIHSEQIHDHNEDTDVSTNFIVDTNKTVEEIESNHLDENNDLMNENLNFHDHPCSEFDNIMFEESLTKIQSDSIEEETLLPSPNMSASSQNSDNEIKTSDGRKFSIDLRSFEKIDTDNEIHLADDDILPLSHLCEQVKNEADIEDSTNNDEQNKLSAGEQIIDDTAKEESHSSESKMERTETMSPSIIVTRSMIASLNLKDSTSSMSLDEKKQLLLEVRKKKSMLRNSILQNKHAQSVDKGSENSLKNNLRMNSSNFVKSSSQKKAPNKLNNTTLNRLTKQNTDKNKEYRCELNVVVVRKDIPKPPSPTSKLNEKMRNGGGIASDLRSHNNKGDNMGSHIPVLKSRGGHQNPTNQGINSESSYKGVHWDENRLTQESSPLVKSSPRTARQGPIPKPCIKPTSPPIDSLGNVLSANNSLTPVVKRGIKVTVKQVKYKGEE